MRTLSLLAFTVLLGSCGGGSQAACLNYIQAANACYERSGNPKRVPTTDCDKPTWSKGEVYDCLAALYVAGNCANEFTSITISDGSPECYKKQLK